MKQISYDFDWISIAGALIGFMRESGDLEDGYWQININTECVTLPFPAPAVGARETVLPGHVVRITGLQLRKVPNLGFMCVEVRNGLIVEIGDGSNTNQRGSEKSSGSFGEDSELVRTSYSTAT